MAPIGVSTAVSTFFCIALITLCGVNFSSGNGSLRWSSWSGEASCSPRSFVRAESERDVIDLVERVARNGQRLKVIGGGHSFSEIALTEDGVMVSLDEMNRVIEVEMLPNGEADVWVEAGIRLYQLNDELALRGLSLGNLGATAEQSIAGATATGTHGTGVEWGSISTAITGFRLITAQGNIVIATPDRSREVFLAGRVHLGALGVVTAVRLRCYPSFRLRLSTVKMDLQELFTQLPTLMHKHPRLQWYYTPYTNDASVLLRDATNEDITGCWDKPKSKSPSNVTSCVDVSYKTLVDSRNGYQARELYTEMEMFIPVDKVMDAIKDFQTYMQNVLPRHSNAVKLFNGVRYVKGDDIWLSPCYGRDTAVISFIVFGTKTETGNQTEMELYARELERICIDKYQGRPHWGKRSWATYEQLSNAYPMWDEFVALREKLDPKGIFLNAYLEEKLGATQQPIRALKHRSSIRLSNGGGV